MRVTNIKREKEFEFPVLLENQRHGTIIIATGYDSEKKVTFKGVCIRSKDGTSEIGEENYWLTDAFTLFKGSLTLEQ